MIKVEVREYLNNFIDSMRTTPFYENFELNNLFFYFKHSIVKKSNHYIYLRFRGADPSRRLITRDVAALTLDVAPQIEMSLCSLQMLCIDSRCYPAHSRCYDPTLDVAALTPDVLNRL